MDESTPTTGRRPRRIGVVLLIGATVASIGVIAWGVGGSTPTTVATLEPVEAQWATVRSGTLVESTRVSATVSRGEIISLVVPTVGGGRASSSGTSAAASAVATPTTIPPTTTTTVPPTTTTTTTTVAGPPTTATAPLAPVDPTSPTTVAPTPTVPLATTPTTTAAAAPPTPAPTARAATTTTTVATPGTAATGGTSADPTTTARVVTAISTVGTVLGAGDTAFAINGRPTIVVPGFVPAWRAIDADTSDGVDVTQLESFLASVGFDADGELTVDEEVDAATISAIEEWQESLDLEATGRVELGEVVFLAGEVTVVATNARVGTVLDSGDSVLDVRSGSPYVDVSTDASWVAVGDEVEVSLGGSSARGTVTSFSSGIARVALRTTTSVRDGSDATVKLQRTKVDGELLVPASAVLRTDLDGATVAVRDGDATRRVRVAVLASANGMAAVRSADDDRPLAEGDEVARY